MKENFQQLQQDIKHDRQMIESSFENNKLLTPKRDEKNALVSMAGENIKIKYKLNEIIGFVA